MYDVAIKATGAGDCHGTQITGVGVAPETHYFMRDVTSNLVSEDGARGYIGNGTASAGPSEMHAHMANCHFHVSGPNGVGAEIVGLLSAPGCAFHGDAVDVKNLSPEADNVLRYTSSTAFDDVDGGGGFVKLSYFDHALRTGIVYVDKGAKDDVMGFENDPSRPFLTVTNAISRAVFVGSSIVDVAPGAYAEAVTVPAGIFLWAPGATFTSVAVAEGGAAVVGRDEVVSARDETGGNIALTDLDSNKIYTNEGAGAIVDFDLPTARAGLRYRFRVQNANGLRVNAAAGDTIRNLATLGGAAGNISSTTVGDTLDIEAINGTEWIAAPAIGTWAVV
jgi:hypothetical protein